MRTDNTNGYRGIPPVDHSSIQRPALRRGPNPNPHPGPLNRQPHAHPLRLKPQLDWMKEPVLTLRLYRLNVKETTHNLWTNFGKEGTVVQIEIFESRDGQRGNGKIIFAPPPKWAFWEKGLYLISMPDGKGRYNVQLQYEKRSRPWRIQSPVKKHIFYDPKMKLRPSALHFGLLVSPESMMSLQRVQTQGPGDIEFEVDLKRKKIGITFKVSFRDPRSEGFTDFVSESSVNHLDRDNKYMIEIPFDQLETIEELSLGEHAFGLLVSLDSPPRFLRKKEDDTAGHSRESLRWQERDTWYRQTDIVYDPYQLQTAKVALHKERPVIDIGRWTTYLFVFPRAFNPEAEFDTMKKALQDFNIATVLVDNITSEPARLADLWTLIDPPQSDDSKIYLQSLDDKESAAVLPFEVRYQLEVCISREYLNEYNITNEFVFKLATIASSEPQKARYFLEYVAEQGKRIYDAIGIFENEEALAYSPKTEIPHYCAYARKATITPSTIYFSSPTVETTNRVLRHYARENEDGRFLRVQFTDEMFEGRIHSCADQKIHDELFTRVYRTLFNGIQIGDRHYEFLAFGNAQFREHGAYFFCPTDHLSCNDIRNWMGNFSHINIPAKYAARLGQCFSTTRAISSLSKPEVLTIPDIERGGYCFTDGVGKISPFLAQMIAVELGIRGNVAPSAFQFRLGGCKGILVVWPDARDKQVHIRKSQSKFSATYNGLEIIRCSRFSIAALNRQTIVILSSLGVPDEVFLRMLTEQLTNYQSAMSDDNMAISLLLRYIDDNQMTISIATMIRNGFMAVRDPFVMSLLHLWRSWSIKLLKEKAKILVEDGAFVLGCVDETGTLRGYTKPRVPRGKQFPVEELPQIFIQVPDKKDPNKYNVIEGICLVGRNPSLHPGDLRVVQAVNVRALHHLRDVVVFPQTGERDVPSMCSGGDLDGDDFFVIWDKGLRPPEWNCEPMDYSPPKPRPLNRPVEIGDLMKFFVRYMKNDSLPKIAHAHMAQSDYLPLSVKDPKCIDLAKLHSKAVDYVKSGQPAFMPKQYIPRTWPHFMEKKFKPKEQQYHSDRILGQLYDKIETIKFVPLYEEPFDKRILKAYKLEDALLKTVRQTKSKYDTAMSRIMANQEVKTEFEVWSTFVLSKPRVGSDYKVQEEMIRISDALKDQFREVCIKAAGGDDFSILGPFVAGMYKVTKEELDIALAECRRIKTVGDHQVPVRKMEAKYMPFISFPWLFEKELGRIATGFDISDGLNDLEPLSLAPKHLPRKRQGAGENLIDDYVEQQDGNIVHRGEELDLFRAPADDEIFAESEYSEAWSDDEDHYVAMNNRKVDSGTNLRPLNIPHLLSRTGVEDVVPRTELDGFIKPHAPSGLDACKFPLVEPIGGPTIDAEQYEEVEEEIVDLEIGESSLEKLARMHGS